MQSSLFIIIQYDIIYKNIVKPDRIPTPRQAESCSNNSALINNNVSRLYITYLFVLGLETIPIC